jgi:drug/metabolite transporter (DMT)-like permease
MARQRGWLGTYLLVGGVWGCSFLFIALSNEFLTPIGVAFWRQLLGALPMVLLVWLKRKSFPKDLKTWFLVFCVSLFMNSVPSVLFSFAERNATSAFAGIMNATTPITTLLMILTVFREEKPARQVLVGLAIGLVGVSAVLEVWNGFGSNDGWAVLALCLATLLYGIGGPFARRYVTSLKLDPQVQVAMQVSMAAVTLTPFYFTQPLALAAPTWSGIAGIVLLGVLGTGFTYIWYYRLMATAGSAVANAVTFMSPVVAVVAGAIFLQESVNAAQLIGGAVVILGAAVSQGRFNNLWHRLVGRHR